MRLLPNSARLLHTSIYAIVSQTRIICLFLKSEQQQFAHPTDRLTVRLNHLAAMQFRRRVWSCLDANATRHDGTRRDAPIKPVDPKRIPYLAPISIFTNPELVFTCQFRAFDPVTTVRTTVAGWKANHRSI